MKTVKEILRLLRLPHYIKNLLVFAALACSGQFTDPKRLYPAVLGFLAFCLMSSAVYIVNDIRDCEKDRQHPTKKNRPIAAGTVSEKTAAVLAGILAVCAMLLSLLPRILLLPFLLLAYLALNLAYSFGLKNVPIADITILVAGFLLRVVYGAAAADITISSWLYLTVITVAFALALGKRRNEAQRLPAEDTRRVLRLYTVEFLDRNMYMCFTLANVFYALWSMDAHTAALYQTGSMVYTVPFVLLITMRYSFVIEGKSDGDPVEVLLHDRVLIVLSLLFLFTIGFILYH